MEKKESRKPIVNFIDWVNGLKEGKRDIEFIYRGQANAKWKLRSAATRRVFGNNAKDDKIQLSYRGVVEYISELIGRLKQKELEKSKPGLDSDLKIMAELQHHGAATPLLDFSRNSLIALWMACSDKFEEDGKDGKVFALNLNQKQKVKKKIDVDELGKKRQVRDYMEEGDTFWIWEPSHFNRRIPAQSSIFLLAPEPYSLVCEEFIISAEDKKSILKDLEEMFGIYDLSIYPDFEGFAQMNVPGKEVRKDYIEAFLEGYEKLKNCDYDGAIKNFDKAIELNPKFMIAYVSRGLAKGRKGDHDGAIKDYDKAIELNPNDVPI